MPDDDSLIVVPRDYADIVRQHDRNILDDIREDPLGVGLQIVTGAIEIGSPRFALASLGRISQAALKSDVQRGVIDVLTRLADAGKLRKDFAKTKYGMNTWTDLMSLIDSDDTPDADRLDALKAAFYAVNKVNATDAERITAYQLWQIAKKLNSGEVLLLRAYLEVGERLGNVTDQAWNEQMMRGAGFEVAELVALHTVRLVELHLVKRPPTVTERLVITNLGRQFCRNIETYKTDLEGATPKT